MIVYIYIHISIDSTAHHYWHLIIVCHDLTISLELNANVCCFELFFYNLVYCINLKFPIKIIQEQFSNMGLRPFLRRVGKNGHSTLQTGRIVASA